MIFLSSKLNVIKDNQENNNMYMSVIGQGWMICDIYIHNLQKLLLTQNKGSLNAKIFAKKNNHS